MGSLHRRRLVSALLVAAAVGGALGKKQGRIPELKGDKYEQAVKKHDRMLVQLTAPCITGMRGDQAPWCEATKTVGEEFQKVAVALKKERLTTKLASADVYTETSLAKRFKINFNPTQESDVPQLPQFRYYVKGRLWSKYAGPREAAGIVAWLRDREQQAVAELGPDEVYKYLNGTTEGCCSLLAHVKPKSSRAQVFWSAVDGELLGAGPFAFRLAAVQLPDKADGNRDASLTLWRPGFAAPDAKQVKYSGAWSEAEMVRWAKKKSYPFIATSYDPRKYSWEILKEIGWDGFAAAVLSPDPNHEPSQAAMVDLLKPLGKNFASWRFLCVAADALDDLALSSLGVSRATVPLVVVFYEGRRYLLTKTASLQSTAAIGGFIDEVKSRRAQPHFRSEPAPETTMDEHGIMVLTGSTFQERVFDASLDVLVAFHAPGCDKCLSEVDPLLKDLARMASERGWQELGFVIARMDGSKNECREEITGFPKVVLYPAVASEKKMEMRVIYPRKYDMKLMVAFLLEYARNLKGVRNEL